MADRINRAYPATQQHLHNISRSEVAQNKPPGAVANGIFQPGIVFPPGAVDGIPDSQIVLQASGGHQVSADVNGCSSPSSPHQAQQPGMISGGSNPAVTAPAFHTPPSLSGQRPPTSPHVPGLSFNGFGSEASRPPAAPLSGKPVRMPLASYQGTNPSGYGNVSLGDAQEISPANFQLQGQAQYSHQNTALEQKSPITTPSTSGPSSEKSSRGSSPVSGSSPGAVEGQPVPGRSSRSNSIPTPGPGTPHKATGAFVPPRQGQLPAQSVDRHAEGLPAFSSVSQQLPPRPGFSPSPSLAQPMQSQQPHLYGHNPAQGSGFPPALSGFPLTVPGFPPPAVGRPTGVSSVATSQLRFPPTPPIPSKQDLPQPPAVSNPGILMPPPAAGRLGNLPPLPSIPGSFPLPSGTPGFAPLSVSGHAVPPPPPVSGPNLRPPFLMGPQSGAAVSHYEPQIPAVQGSQYGQPRFMQHGVSPYTNNTNAITQKLNQLKVNDSQRVVNLLTERELIPPDGIEMGRPMLAQDFNKVNCSPEIFMCTLNAVPQNSALLNKARLPLGILIHPFKDLTQLPVIQSNVIVRCRSCRTYINPFVVFVDQRRWKCNLCFRVNDLPDEFSFDPISKTYGDPQRRPEVKTATIEFIAPSEYMLRPPQPAVYLFLLDVSFNAVETGYLSEFCKILQDELNNLPGDARTSIGFLCYDSALYYFNLANGLSQPQMLCVPDLDDLFLPCPDNLLANLHESRELVVDLLSNLPKLFESNYETGSALGAALQAALKLMSPTGGRVTVMQTCLPTVGPGALHNRDTGNTSAKNIAIIGPATDFYKKLSLDCSAKQVAVDLFLLNGQYADIATLSCISKYSAGCIYYYPSFHTVRNANMVGRFDADFRRYLTRKIGFESVMRIRCTRGLSIHTFHGNFFVRSTDLLSLPNINPDAGFGMQMSIEDNLTETGTVSFQAALLYTSCRGERRIRVHTLCLPVTDQLSEVFASADQVAIAALLSKMAVDRSLNSAIGDARESMMNASLDALMAYNQQIPASQRVGAILAPYSLRLMPMFILTMLKNLAFSLSGNTKVDDRVFAMQQFKVLPVSRLIQKLYPYLYPLHKLSDEKPIKHGQEEIPIAPILQLSSANIDRTGLFLLDTGEAMYLLVGSAIGDQMCQDVFGKPNFTLLADGMNNLPELKNPTSEKIRSFIKYLRDSRPEGVTLLIIREDSKQRHLFTQYLLEDKMENSMSYHEFLQFLQGKRKC